MHKPEEFAVSEYFCSPTFFIRILLVPVQLIHRTMLFTFGFPLLEITVFFLAIGGDPKGLKFAVVDEELGNFTDCTQYSLVYPITPLLHNDLTCDYRGLSCNYLNRINESKVRYWREEAQQLPPYFVLMI